MDDSAIRDSRGRLLRQLREQLGRSETTLATADAAAFSSGAAALDHLLPGSGLRHGMLVEWLSEQPASGAATLSLLAAREASGQGGIVVVVDRRQMFYPPAAAAWGVDLARLIVVHPQTAREELWAAVQSLRSPVVAAVWASIERLDDRTFRRLQLAAEAGRTLGLLLRPASARGQPSWADVRLLAKSRGYGAGSLESLSACCRRIEVRVLRCHGGRPGGSAYLEIDDAAHAVREVKPGALRPNYPTLSANTIFTNHDTHPLPVVAELADPTAHPFSAGA
jgi:hypothetical protein